MALSFVPRLCLGTHCLRGSASLGVTARQSLARQCVPRQSLGTRRYSFIPAIHARSRSTPASSTRFAGQRRHLARPAQCRPGAAGPTAPGGPGRRAGRPAGRTCRAAASRRARASCPAAVVNSSSIWALPPPASTWQCAQLACRYDRARTVRSLGRRRGRRAPGTAPAAAAGASTASVAAAPAAAAAARVLVQRPVRSVLRPLAEPALSDLVGPVALQDAEVLEHAELVVAHAAGVVVLAVHLQLAQAEHEVGRPAVADHALGPARVVPRLRRVAAGRGPCNVAVQPGRVDQRGVGLLVVPDVGVADPLAVLLGQEARLDPVARRRVARLRSRAKVLTSTVRRGSSSRAVRVKSIRPPGGRARNRSLCSPSDQSGALTEYGITPGLHPVPAYRREQPALAQLSRERRRPVVRRRRLQGVERRPGPPAGGRRSAARRCASVAKPVILQASSASSLCQTSLGAVVPDAPDAAGRVVAVDVGPAQLRQLACRGRRCRR